MHSRPRSKTSHNRVDKDLGSKAMLRANKPSEASSRQNTQAVKHRSKKRTSVLATCPVSGAGWCPYPFSLKELQKRIEKAAKRSAARSRAKLSGETAEEARGPQPTERLTKGMKARAAMESAKAAIIRATRLSVSV